MPCAALVRSIANLSHDDAKATGPGRDADAPSVHCCSTRQYMLVEHIVFLKLTRPLTEDEHKRVLTPLGRISGMLSMSCGSTYSERGMGFNFCIKITFASKEDEIAFRTHPLHAQLRAEIIQPLIDTNAPAPTMIAIDYENDDGSLSLARMAAVTNCGAGVLIGLLLSRLRR